MSTAVMSLTESDLKACVELALQHARQLGASEAEVGVSVDTGVSVTARMREVDGRCVRNARKIEPGTIAVSRQPIPLTAAIRIHRSDDLLMEAAAFDISI